MQFPKAMLPSPSPQRQCFLLCEEREGPSVAPRKVGDVATRSINAKHLQRGRIDSQRVFPRSKITLPLLPLFIQTWLGFLLLVTHASSLVAKWDPGGHSPDMSILFVTSPLPSVRSPSLS